MELLLHPLAKIRFDQIVADPPQSVLLIAPAGSGKETVLNEIAKKILGRAIAGNLFVISPEEDKKTIGIDTIRELKMTLRLKSSAHRIVLIPHAEQLTEEAQNSLLKLLEEPPAQVHFLMAATKLGDMLETIQSRTSVWRLLLPTSQQLQQHFADYAPAPLARALAIGQSRVGLISALVSDNTNHELLHAIDTAKEILGEKHFDRLVRVDSLAKDIIQTNLLLEALELTCKAALEHAASNNAQSVRQWHKRLQLVVDAQELLSQNVQTKLVLSHLFMKM